MYFRLTEGAMDLVWPTEDSSNQARLDIDYYLGPEEDSVLQLSALFSAKNGNMPSNSIMLPLQHCDYEITSLGQISMALLVNNIEQSRLDTYIITNPCFGKSLDSLFYQPRLLISIDFMPCSVSGATDCRRVWHESRCYAEEFLPRILWINSKDGMAKAQLQDPSHFQKRPEETGSEFATRCVKHCLGEPDAREFAGIIESDLPYSEITSRLTAQGISVTEHECQGPGVYNDEAFIVHKHSSNDMVQLSGLVRDWEGININNLTFHVAEVCADGTTIMRVTSDDMNVLVDTDIGTSLACVGADLPLPSKYQVI